MRRLELAEELRRAQNVLLSLERKLDFAYPEAARILRKPEALTLANAYHGAKRRVELILEQLPPPPGNDNPEGGTPLAQEKAA